MPEYRFLCSRDPDGRVPPTMSLPDADAARDQAVIYLGELLKDEDGRFWEEPELNITVQDATGLTLFSLDVTGRSAPAVSRRRSPPA